MAVKSTRGNVVQLARPTLRETIGRLAPGTALRDGLERILRGRTGALILLGYDERVETICDGGFSLDVRFAPTRLRELSKMDGAVVLSSDGSRIVRANVQLVPDPTIPTDESGTRHRSAERAAIQTGYPVVSVSHSMNIVTVYVAGERHVVRRLGDHPVAGQPGDRDAGAVQVPARRSEQATVDGRDRGLRHAARRDDGGAAAGDGARIGLEIDADVVELGTDGRQLSCSWRSSSATTTPPAS